MINDPTDERRCFDCSHIESRHDENGYCLEHWIDAGGGGRCGCAKFRVIDDEVEGALITIMRSLPRYNMTPVHIICKALGREVPSDWQRTIRVP